RTAARSRRRKVTEYEGIIPRLERLLSTGEIVPEEEGDDGFDDESVGEGEVGRFVVTRVCDGCKGRRLRPEALAVRLGDRNIAELGNMPLRAVRTFLGGLVTGEGGAVTV